MVTSKYFDFNLTKKEFKTESIKLDNIISFMLKKMNESGFDHIEAIKAIKILNVYCDKKGFALTDVSGLSISSATSSIINRLQERKQKLVLQEYDENYENLFDDIEEISDEDFAKLKDLLEEIKSLISNSDIESSIRKALIIDITNIINNLSSNIKDIDKTKGQITTFIDNVLLAKVDNDFKDKAIEIASGAFTLCRKILLPKLPNSLEYEFKGTIKLTNTQNSVEDEIIDVETTQTNQLEKK